jgi:release factor glutamine methyltransferase
MKIASNKIKDILAYFRQELASLYEKEEVARFAEFCFAEFAGYSRSDILLNPEKTVHESDLLKFHFAVKELKRGKPIQYILGKAWFYGMEFIVSPAVLIPRPETEELVRLVLDESKLHKESFSILDAGTGSGCIAVTLRKKIDRCHVYAADVSAEALSIARENSEKQECEIHFLQLDLLNEKERAKLPLLTFIVSNPPYITQSEKSSLSANVIDHEPHLALFTPQNDPLIFYRALAELGNEKLKPGGSIFAEINETLGIETCILFQKLGYTDVQLKQDLQGKDRFVVAGKR